MKKTLIFTICLLAALTTYAQVDVKINPIGAIFGSPDLSAEFGVTENFGVEVGAGFNLGKNTILDATYKRSGVAGFLAGKYYFNPDQGVDKFGVGLYTRFRKINNEAELDENTSNNFSRTLFAGGLLITQKWVSSGGVVFEIDFGAGRAFVNNIKFDDDDSNELALDDLPVFNIDVLLRFAVGYRF